MRIKGFYSSLFCLLPSFNYLILSFCPLNPTKQKSVYQSDVYRKNVTKKLKLVGQKMLLNQMTENFSCLPVGVGCLRPTGVTLSGLRLQYNMKYYMTICSQSDH